MNFVIKHRWVIGLALSFLTVVIANLVLVAFALDDPDPIVESYEVEPR